MASRTVFLSKHDTQQSQSMLGYTSWLSSRLLRWQVGQKTTLRAAPFSRSSELARLDAVNVEQALVSTREPLDQPVKIITALAERLHRDALVLAVGAHVVHVARKPGMPVGRNAGIAQISGIGPGGAHYRADGHPAPELLGGFLDGAQKPLVERRRRAEHILAAADHRNLVVAEHANEGSFHVLHLLGRHDAAIDDGPRNLRQRVDGMPAL